MILGAITASAVLAADAQMRSTVKPRIKRSNYVVLPLTSGVVIGNYWECNGATGLTPWLAYKAWQLELEQRQRVAPAAEVVWWRRAIEWIGV